MTERCICCGEIIPEGRQICQRCENEGMILKLVPVEDIVAVVRCKDCKHRGQLYRNHLCDHPASPLGRVSDDTFCSYGERKDDNDI